MPMKTDSSLFVTARIIVASFVCVVILFLVVPSLGSVSLPNHKIGYGWRDALSVGIILAPLLVILIGVSRSNIIEVIGWVLWFALVAFCVVEIVTK
jgi:hypothetical protein